MPLASLRFTIDNITLYMLRSYSIGTLVLFARRAYVNFWKKQCATQSLSWIDHIP
ncbi:MAG: hypothetical protein NVS2B12_01840 [Ktedonobacteraceae bacterium]